MALDFPNSPTLNQTFVAPSGVIWLWDGAKWTAVSSVSPNAPDADVGRNLIHNSLFNVAQRGNGPFTISTNYSLDRWMILSNLDTMSVTRQGMSDASRAQIGDEGGDWMLTNAFTGNAGAAAYNVVQQKIENVRRLSGKSVTISFWARAAAGTPKIGVNFYQNFGTGGSPSAQVTVAGQSVTINATAFARYSLTFALPSVSGMTTGTNNDHYTALMLWYSAGATNAAASGSVGQQSGTIFLWGVQLEVGTVATPLEKLDPRYDLSNCQRFYQVLPGVVVSSPYNLTPGQQVYGGFALPVTMRAVPQPVIQSPSYSNASGFTASVPSAAYVVPLVASAAAGNVYATATLLLSADL